MPTHFLIFAHARSGSTTLAEIFACQESTTVALEPFNLNLPGNYREILSENGLPLCVERIYERYDGFKHLCGHLTAEQDRWLLANTSSVFLRRRNMFAAALSHSLASALKVWIPAPGEKYPPDTLPEIPVEVIVGTLRWLNLNMDAQERTLAEHVLRVSYEELYQEGSERSFEVIERIFDFFGRKITNSEKARWWLDKDRKLNSEEVYCRIPNYDEIVSLAKSMGTSLS